MEYRLINQERAVDIRLPNEPFPLFGRMMVSFCDGKWNSREEVWPDEKHSEMCFPEENYDYDALCKDHVFIGAYENGRCVGVAILADAMFRYMYLEDLKVSSAYRRKGIGEGLIRASLAAARERGYRGVYTIGQNDNLAACRFYLKCGFEIGGYNNRDYRGTSQEGKADIYFYID